jgi:hypothetical protein
MGIRSRFIFSSIIVLMAASVAFAKDVTLPKIDLQKQCQTTQNSTDALTGTKNPNAFDLCMKSELSARDTLIERWATIPAQDKANCIHASDWAPSYFEWLGCIDTKTYVRTMRRDHPEPTAASGLCPTVKWLPDGSIASVAPCDVRR